jgi:hypothetical protein
MAILSWIFHLPTAGHRPNQNVPLRASLLYGSVPGGESEAYYEILGISSSV